MKIQFQKLFPDTQLPSYAHPGDAGMDLYAHEEVVLVSGARAAVSLGFALAIPMGYVSRILDRSGLAIKNGLHCLAGVVDSGYRGEYKAIIVNLSGEEYKIEKGDRVAQLLVQPVEICEIEEVKILNETARGIGGFGGSGKK
jgi:deoxyuridine 5'-triphosphate nucleotidohydrolase